MSTRGGLTVGQALQGSAEFRRIMGEGFDRPMYDNCPNCRTLKLSGYHLCEKCYEIDRAAKEKKNGK